MNSSVVQMWDGYLRASGKSLTTPVPPVWHFCDNQEDADTCATLVLSGRKYATAPSLWFFESRELDLPAEGDLDIFTDWQGVAQGIIRTTRVSIVRFCDVSAEHAAAEGEGDGSLKYWRAAHREYYRRELIGTSVVPDDEMPVVCQYFELIYPERTK